MQAFSRVIYRNCGTSHGVTASAEVLVLMIRELSNSRRQKLSRCHSSPPNPMMLSRISFIYNTLDCTILVLLDITLVFIIIIVYSSTTTQM